MDLIQLFSTFTLIDANYVSEITIQLYAYLFQNTHRHSLAPAHLGKCTATNSDVFIFNKIHLFHVLVDQYFP